MLLIKVFFAYRACNVVLKSFKYESVTLPDEFIFMFVPYFMATISAKIVVKSGGFQLWAVFRRIVCFQ